ncbi:MAG: TonB-dependent receptor [Thiohalomonadaceae bacterium]
MKRTLVYLGLIFFPPQVLLAESAMDAMEEEQFLALLDEQTAIATRTRINADFVPGMVSVLHGENLEARGARTVWEALALVPGMELAIEMTGRRKVLVRGLGNTWASGNLKILLNDVAMNSAELGLADPVFNIPIEQVERIEVIRGPGSAIHGEYAYMGVVNVITRAEENRVFAFGGSFDTRGLGAVLRLTEIGNPIQASLNLAGWSGSGADVKTGPDLLHGFPALGPSYAPGEANEDIEAGTAVFKLGYEHFALSAQWSEAGLGDHFGTNHMLPPDSDRIVERSRHRAVDVRQELPVSTALTAGIHLGWKDVERRRDDLFVMPSNAGPDLYLDTQYLETTTSAGIHLLYRGWDKHSVLLAGSLSTVRVDRSRYAFTQPAQMINIPEGSTRSINAVTLQDEYRHSDLFTLTVGLRYDEYSDVGGSYSPRLAGVWRLNPRHVLKAQYAEAFRPPTLFENETVRFHHLEPIDPATIQTTELGYIYKGGHVETRLTGFYSRLSDLVTFAQANIPAFGNQGATIWGVELEQSWHPGRRWLLDGNVSYVETHDDASDECFPGAAQWLANAGITYKKGKFLAALQAHYVSSYKRQPEDPRDTLDGYTTLDFTGSLLPTRGLQLRVGVKNLLDEDVRFPSPVIGDNTRTDVTYPEDFPRARRTWWAQASYRY